MPCIELTTCRMCNFWTVVASCVRPEIHNLKLYIRHRLWNLQTKIASCCLYSQNSCFFFSFFLIWSSYLIDTVTFCVWLHAAITICCSQQYFNTLRLCNLTEYRFSPLTCTSLMNTWCVLLFQRECFASLFGGKIVYVCNSCVSYNLLWT